MYKQYCKLKDAADKQKEKVKFAVTGYMESLIAEKSNDKIKEGIMMWEQQYTEFAKTAAVCRGRPSLTVASSKGPLKVP